MKRICLAALISMGASFMAAVPGQAATVTPTPPGVPLTISNVPFAGDSYDPRVSGDIVTYSFSPFASANSFIHYQNVVTGVDATVPPVSPYYSVDFLSDIDNGRIVFSRDIVGIGFQVFLFDTSTPLVAPQEVSPTPAPAREFASIGGNTIAFTDFASGSTSSNIKVYDLATATLTSLTNDGGTIANFYPDVSPDGTVVAWVNCPTDLSNVTGCQVWDAIRGQNGWTTRQLTNDTDIGISRPATDGQSVVYSRGVVGTTSSSIDYQPVLGGVEQTITIPASTGITEEFHLSISGGLVAFAGLTATGSASIWVADLVLGTVYQVSPVVQSFSFQPDISLATDGTVTVVWTTQENGQSNVYGFRYHLDRTAPVLTLPSNITVGATSAAGLAVSYTVTASDPDNPASQLTINCTPASGTIFPVGTTIVTCTASDAQLNTTTGSFTVTVVQTSTSIATSATSANTGGAISDTAVLSGGFAPTGTITFYLFGPNNAVCSGAPVFTSTAPVNGNGIYKSLSFTAAVAGTYRWVAFYGGDAGNSAVADGACPSPSGPISPNETSNVTKVTPMITTQATSANTSGTITDTATFSGGNAPTGTITFTLIGPVTAPCTGPAVFTSVKPVSGNGGYTSAPFTPVLPGTYQWFTAYSGDANNNVTTTACKAPDETSTVTEASPTITTQATSTANAAGTITDTATISLGNAPTGTVTFTLFGPDNASCSGTPVFTLIKPVVGDGNYTSDPYNSFGPIHPGAYRWIASYSGDANNIAAATACNDLGETSAVTKASPNDVSAVVGQLLAAGCIDNAGIANALTAKLAAAQSAIAAGNLKTAINILSAFIDQVQAQSAKHIHSSCTLAGVTFDPAAVLVADARSIIDSLAVSATANPITGSVVTATGSGVSGATVSLIDSATGTTLARGTTDVTGFYFFATTGLLNTNGTYSVSVTGLPTGFATSSAAQMFTWTGSPISLGNFILTL